MEKKFNIQRFIKKLFSPEPVYLSRAEKEHVLLMISDNEDYRRILDILDERTYRKKYLKEEREKRKGMLYPDADEIYMRYFNQRDLIKELKQKCLEKDTIIYDLHKKIMELTEEAWQNGKKVRCLKCNVFLSLKWDICGGFIAQSVTFLLTKKRKDVIIFSRSASFY